MAAKEKEKRDAPPRTKKSEVAKNLFLLSLLGLVVLGGLAYISFDPQDLSDIEGYREQPGPPPVGGRNLASVLESAVKNKHGVRIEEKELNEYLLRTLRFEQEGFFKSWVEAKGVWIRLEKNLIEVIFEREVKGKRHTISMLLRPEQKEQEDGTILTTVDRKKGRWGKTKVLNGFMLLTNASFKSLAAQYPQELEVLRRMFKSMYRITVSEGVIELSPPGPAEPDAPDA